MSFALGINWYNDVDALFIKLRDTEHGHSQPPDGERGPRDILFDKNGDVLGIEFLYVSDGVAVDDLPIPEPDLIEVQRLLAEAGVEIKSPIPV